MRTQKDVYGKVTTFICVSSYMILTGILWLSGMSLAAEDTWTTKADMPTERWGLSTCVVGGKIYAIGGGQDPFGKYPSTLEVYNPVTDTWTKKADMPAARCFLSTSAVNGKIYAIGGRIYPGDFDARSVEVYDPATDTWTTKADMPTEKCWLSTSAVNGKIYAIGGVIGFGWFGGPGTSIVEEYDPATDTWTKKADMPTGRKAPSTSVVDGKIYAIGGRTDFGPVFSTVEEYDPATDTWTRKADMPTARHFHSSSAVNGKIYAIGGSVVVWPWTPTSAVEVYDTGFVPKSVEAKGKLATTWGEIK